MAHQARRSSVRSGLTLLLLAMCMSQPVLSLLFVLGLFVARLILLVVRAVTSLKRALSRHPA